MKIGDKITIDHKLERKKAYHTTICEITEIPVYNRVWKTKEIPLQPAIFLGYRRLSDGRVYFQDEYSEYEPTVHFKAALVKTYDNQNPFYVRAEDVKEVK